MTDLEYLAAEAAQLEVEAAVLAARIDELGERAPGLIQQRPDGRIEIQTYGVSGSFDALGQARSRRDILARHVDYLRQRWETLEARAERRHEAQARAAAGISRFVEGRFDLDRIAATTAASPEAATELRQAQIDQAAAARAAELDRTGSATGRSAAGDVGSAGARASAAENVGRSGGSRRRPWPMSKGGPSV